MGYREILIGFIFISAIIVGVINVFYDKKNENSKEDKGSK